MRVVIKIGGHLLFENFKPNFKKYVKTLGPLSKKLKILHIITGGGPPARAYVKEGRSLGIDEASLDLLGIDLSWINAYLLYKALKAEGYEYHLPPKNPFEVLRYVAEERNIVSGGFTPGQSTAAVAAIIAEVAHADLLIYATDVSGIYTSDPKEDRNAKLLPEVTIDELREILKRRERAGEYKLLDTVALNIISRSKIKTLVINGLDPQNIVSAINGEKLGTLLKP